MISYWSKTGADLAGGGGRTLHLLRAGIRPPADPPSLYYFEISIILVKKGDFLVNIFQKVP